LLLADGGDTRAGDVFNELQWYLGATNGVFECLGRVFKVYVDPEEMQDYIANHGDDIVVNFDLIGCNNSLTYLAAKTCAESGLCATLTADTLDLVLAFDPLLYLRYLLPNTDF
jgi:hypothetical protein